MRNTQPTKRYHRSTAEKSVRAPRISSTGALTSWVQCAVRPGERTRAWSHRKIYHRQDCQGQTTIQQHQGSLLVLNLPKIEIVS
jgi:hypothetical protein